jgi:hypothetical protein
LPLHARQSRSSRTTTTPKAISPGRSRIALSKLLPAIILLAVFAAYSNHFHNGFHFDDFHTIVRNPAIRRLGNIPRFFTSPTLFSSEPEGRTWRPLVSTSLAIDYAIARGLKPFWFQLSTFCWFCVQLILMFLLFRRVTSNEWAGFLATAIYGLHPVCADTVNYIIQRGEVYDALGILASLLWFISRPRQRKYGLYLIPAVLAYLSKAPALIFPFILLSYVLLFEPRAWRSTLPAFAVTAVAAILTAKMTPATYSPGAVDPAMYRFTQSRVALHYFRCFFFPTGLSADPDWDYVPSPFSPQAVAGYLFIAAVIASALWTARRRATRPIAFGLLWFLLTLLPTAVTPLADVTNDHRMYLPFIGLSLSVVWSLTLLSVAQPVAQAFLTGCVLVLALATHHRNEVWRTDESLWRDVIAKNPENGRGLMNYGAVLMDRRDYTGALPYLQRAEEYLDSPNLEWDLGATYHALGREEEAETHFKRAAAWH